MRVWGFRNPGGGGGGTLIFSNIRKIRKIGLYLGVISMHFRIFSQGQCTEWGIFFWVAKISNIFLGCLKFLIFLGVIGRC